MSPGASRPATLSGRNAYVGKIPHRRRKWYPIALLADQGNRSVHEIMAWIESGKLRAANTSDGWLVHRDQLDVWRELCNEPRPVFTNLRALLEAHPELQEIRDEMSSAIFAKPSYDAARHAKAKADWDLALERLGVVFKPSSHPGMGFGAGVELPDPDEPGFNPIDRDRFDNEKDQEDR